jgi:hypothetical protein
VIQIERSLHEEITIRLRPVQPDCVIVPIPNGTWIPQRSPEDRKLIARLVARMKDEGQLLPGAWDFACLWGTGSGVIELKRPAGRTLLGKHPAGRLSDDQNAYGALCDAHGVRRAVAHSWDEFYGALADWGRF